MLLNIAKGCVLLCASGRTTSCVSCADVNINKVTTDELCQGLWDSHHFNIAVQCGAVQCSAVQWAAQELYTQICVECTCSYMLHHHLALSLP